MLHSNSLNYFVMLFLLKIVRFCSYMVMIRNL